MRLTCGPDRARSRTPSGVTGDEVGNRGSPTLPLHVLYNSSSRGGHAFTEVQKPSIFTERARRSQAHYSPARGSVQSHTRTHTRTHTHTHTRTCTHTHTRPSAFTHTHTDAHTHTHTHIHLLTHAPSTLTPSTLTDTSLPHTH